MSSPRGVSFGSQRSTSSFEPLSPSTFCLLDGDSCLMVLASSGVIGVGPAGTLERI